MPDLDLEEIERKAVSPYVAPLVAECRRLRAERDGLVRELHASRAVWAAIEKAGWRLTGDLRDRLQDETLTPPEAPNG